MVFQLFCLRKSEICWENLRVSEVGVEVENSMDLKNFVLVNPF